MMGGEKQTIPAVALARRTAVVDAGALDEGRGDGGVDRGGKDGGEDGREAKEDCAKLHGDGLKLGAWSVVV